MKQLIILSLVVCILSCFSCHSKPTETKAIDLLPSTPVINYSVVNYFPHDSTLFTEGFLMHEGQLFESSGAPENLPQTRSVIGIIDLKTGKLQKKAELDRSKYFGEGIAILKNKLYQLTYKNQLGFIYDARSFKQIGQFTYNNKEGWSLTTDGTYLIMSDGTDTLTYIDPIGLKPAKILKVTENGLPRDSLNELEFIRGFIYANIWANNCIVKINPSSGKVVGKMDLSSLVMEAKIKNPEVDVLNGIAYDSTTDRIYVTGKLWTNIYQINFPH